MPAIYQLKGSERSEYLCARNVVSRGVAFVVMAFIFPLLIKVWYIRYAHKVFHDKILSLLQQYEVPNIFLLMVGLGVGLYGVFYVIKGSRELAAVRDKYDIID